MTRVPSRGPLGQKAPKPEKKPRKPVRKRSAKRAAYMASDDRIEAEKHMERVKMLPCICCGAPPPSAAHHVEGDKKPRDDMRVIPLCYACHQGQDGYHNAKRSWVARNGTDYGFLARVQIMLAEQNEQR